VMAFVPMMYSPPYLRVGDMFGSVSQLQHMFSSILFAFFVCAKRAVELTACVEYEEELMVNRFASFFIAVVASISVEQEFVLRVRSLTYDMLLRCADTPCDVRTDVQDML
jgi:hypothetical protein